MGKFKHFFLPIVFIVCSIGYVSAEVIIPEKPNPVKYCNDFAGIFQLSEVQELEQFLSNYKDSTSTQIVVVTVKELDDLDPSIMSAKIGDKWGVGNADKDNGIIFLIAPNDRKFHISTGRGINSTITDLFLIRLKENYILPSFKKGNYFEGVKLGLIQITNKLNGVYVNDETTNAASDEISLSTLILILVLFIFFLWIISKVSKAVNYGETYSGRGYHGGIGGGFWGAGGGSSWGSSGGSSWGSSGGDSWGGGSFDGGGAGGDW